VDYSIIIPVFNKAALTRQCLLALPETIADAGEGEVIVIDNASDDETPQMLTEFPWVRVVRNDRNQGFAAANNQGAAIARGRFLVLLNNDIVPHPGWLAAMLSRAREESVGAVGARLLFPDGTIQHAGVTFVPVHVGLPAFVASHHLGRMSGDQPAAAAPAELQCVTAACMVTPRSLYLELGGLDESFWNGYEDVDYCLRVHRAGLRIIYEPRAVLTHYESQSGTQRFRRAPYNIALLARRWNQHVACDAGRFYSAFGLAHREEREAYGRFAFKLERIPPIVVVLHGSGAASARANVERALRQSGLDIERIVVAEDGAIAAAREAMEHRGDRYLLLLDGRVQPPDTWYRMAIAELESSYNRIAVTASAAGEDPSQAVRAASDARCTLVALRMFPQHVRLEDFPTLGGATADLLLRAIRLHVGVSALTDVPVVLPPPPDDPAFARRYGRTVAEMIAPATASDLEAIIRAQTCAEVHPSLVSIVMLSWNAPHYTKLALESIRAHTSVPHEIIIVDNGSREETTAWLRTLRDVRVVFNPSNKGYAGGNNQGLALARGDYVVLLNNDVVVTEGWLEGLLDPFRRLPALGVTAPRSNLVAGSQQVADASYKDLTAMHAYAASRRRRFRGSGYVTDRAIGLCLCIDRRVIDEIGGIDERFAVGNFEDDDFCLRVRAAGYRIYVCDDVFIHHFGSRSFVENKVDYTATMRSNWAKFAAKWEMPPAYPENGYDSRPAIRRGFDRKRHYVPLPDPPPIGMHPSEMHESSASSAGGTESQAPEEPPASVAVPRAPDRGDVPRLAFLAVVPDEERWGEVRRFVRRYLRAFDHVSPVVLAIAAGGSLPAERVAARVARIAREEGLADDRMPDVLITDERDPVAWSTTIIAERRFRIHRCGSELLDALPLVERVTPGALRALLGEASE
jgi:GT2 family glycosyltransferase